MEPLQPYHSVLSLLHGQICIGPAGEWAPWESQVIPYTLGLFGFLIPERATALYHPSNISIISAPES